MVTVVVIGSCLHADNHRGNGDEGCEEGGVSVKAARQRLASSWVMRAVALRDAPPTSTSSGHHTAQAGWLMQNRCNGRGLARFPSTGVLVQDCLLHTNSWARGERNACGVVLVLRVSLPQTASRTSAVGAPKPGSRRRRPERKASRPTLSEMGCSHCPGMRRGSRGRVDG